MTADKWRDPEAPDADAGEQSTPVVPDEADDDRTERRVTRDDVDEYDAFEQTIEVREDEDEYR